MNESYQIISIFQKKSQSQLLSWLWSPLQIATWFSFQMNYTFLINFKLQYSVHLQESTTANTIQTLLEVKGVHLISSIKIYSLTDKSIVNK